MTAYFVYGGMVLASAALVVMWIYIFFTPSLDLVKERSEIKIRIAVVFGVAAGVLSSPPFNIVFMVLWGILLGLVVALFPGMDNFMFLLSFLGTGLGLFLTAVTLFVIFARRFEKRANRSQ